MLRKVQHADLQEAPKGKGPVRSRGELAGGRSRVVWNTWWGCGRFRGYWGRVDLLKTRITKYGKGQLPGLASPGA